MQSENTRAGSKSSQEIKALREAPLSLLVPEGYKIDPDAYVRWRDAVGRIAPELIVIAARR